MPTGHESPCPRKSIREGLRASLILFIKRLIASVIICTLTRESGDDFDGRTGCKTLEIAARMSNAQTLVCLIEPWHFVGLGCGLAEPKARSTGNAIPAGSHGGVGAQHRPKSGNKPSCSIRHFDGANPYNLARKTAELVGATVQSYEKPIHL